MIKSYRYPQIRNIYFGPAISKKTGEIVKYEGVKKILIITDNFLYSNGIMNGITESLSASGVDFAFFADVLPNPTISNVMQCYESLKKNGCDAVLGLGGGSSIDVCKAAAMLVTNEPPLAQYYGVDKVPNNPIPIFTCPTTSGTGSEATSGGIYVNEETGLKGGIISHRMMATAAIVDPLLTLTLPPHLTAATGMDALAHAIEAYTNVNVNPQSELFCREAIKLVADNLRLAVSQSSNVEARTNMSMAAMYAGIALGGSGCAACHALAYPLEGKYHVPHGSANAALLAETIRYNAPVCQEKYRDIAILMGECVEGMSLRDAALKAADAVATLCEDIDIPSLAKFGMTEEDVEPFANIAIKNDRLMPQNPCRVTLEGAMRIYRNSL